MIKSLLKKTFHFISFNFFSVTSSHSRKTFTYFLPAPPNRKTGYQEKELDFLMNYLNEQGLKIVDFKIATLSGNPSGQNGMWALFVLDCTSEQARHLNIDLEYNEMSKGKEKNVMLHPDIIHD